MVHPIRFLVSGPGLIGKKHCTLIREMQDCELAAIVAPSTEKNQSIADEFKTKLFASIDQALHGSEDQAAENIDAVIISSPNVFHFEQAVTCIRHKIPVLIEKPVTDSLESARKLSVLASKSKSIVLVGHHRTHSMLLSSAERFIRSNRFGRLVSVIGSAQFYKPEQYFKEGVWRTQVGGGPILINLIHEIGLMRHFCGEISQVVALASNSVRGYEVEDSVSISIRFANGALGTFLLSDTAASSKSWEMTTGENPAYPYFPDENCYHFAGTLGSLDFPSMRVRSYSPNSDRSWWLPFNNDRLSVEREDPLLAQLKNFVASIKGEELPLVTAHDGYQNMLVIDAISRSIRENRIVELTELEQL